MVVGQARWPYQPLGHLRARVWSILGMDGSVLTFRLVQEFLCFSGPGRAVSFNQAS